MSSLAATEILRAAAERAPREKVDTPEIKRALAKLKPRCPERWPLDMFWDSAGGENEIGRSQGTRAALNGTCRQPGLPLWTTDA